MSVSTRSTATALLALCAFTSALTSCSSAHRTPVGAVPSTVSSTAGTSTSTTTVEATTTTTTTDPGSLPQTSQLPSGDDPRFVARMANLLQAVSSGTAAQGAPAFFPLSAYIQVKGISDPVHDYRTRLIPDYDQDIEALHSQLGASAGTATLDHVSVPAAAEWIRPGVEYNKGSYWRVYGARLWFRTGGQLHYFTIASMISWRGQWYVVHLSSIR